VRTFVISLLFSLNALTCDDCLKYCIWAESMETGLLNAKGECICGYKADVKKIPVKVPKNGASFKERYRD
jgi:hypothetical protein